MKVVAPDIWTPHTKAVRADLSSARIIFDLFHTVAGYHWEVLVRPGRARPYGNMEDEQERRLTKGSCYSRATNKEKLSDKQRPRLDNLLRLNEETSTAYIQPAAFVRSRTLKMNACANAKAAPAPP